MSILFDPEPSHDNPGTLLGIGLAAFICYFLVVPAVYQILSGKSLAPASQPTSQPVEAIDPHAVVILSIASPIVGFIVLLAGNSLWRKDPFAKLGFTPKNLRKGGWQFGLLASAIILPLMFAVVILTGKFWEMIHYSHPAEHELLHILGGETNPAMRAAIILSAIILAPLFEEFLFRGMIQNAVEMMLASAQPVIARWAAIITASISFALVHIDYTTTQGVLWMLPPIFFLSICMGYAYNRTRNLWVPIIVHASFNAASVVMSIYLR